MSASKRREAILQALDTRRREKISNLAAIRYNKFRKLKSR